jgi:dolichol-phosphate mannosyltransferase
MNNAESIILKEKKESLPLYTVLIPVMNEIESLNETISIILEQNQKNFEFVIILSPKTKFEARQNALEYEKKLNSKISIITQIKPGIGGAYQDGINICRGDYIIMIASDLETDPNLVKDLIALSVLNPDKIITTTRWRGEGAGFEGYGVLKYVLNWIFQKTVSYLFHFNLTDYTFGFRLYPKESIKTWEWKEFNFAFLLESILIPLREGWKVIETPHNWKPRVEETSNNKFIYYLSYFRVVSRVKFRK